MKDVTERLRLVVRYLSQCITELQALLDVKVAKEQIESELKLWTKPLSAIDRIVDKLERVCEPLAKTKELVEVIEKLASLVGKSKERFVSILPLVSSKDQWMSAEFSIEMLDNISERISRSKEVTC